MSNNGSKLNEFSFAQMITYYYAIKIHYRDLDAGHEEEIGTV